METMRDLQYLKTYRLTIVENLSATFEISLEGAGRIVDELESGGLLKIEAPCTVELPAEVLMNDGHLPKTEFGMTSHKVGNVILNFQKDWRDVIALAASLVEVALSIEGAQPALIAAGIVGSIISASKLTDISINANGTAIILALQKHKEHKRFAITEEQCRREANEILVLNGYESMDNKTFDTEITNLISYQCIDKEDQIIKLCETVLFHY